jgi:hypothetical protein
MNVSAAIADLLLRQAFGRQARPLEERGLAPSQSAEPVPWPPRAGLATQLNDFATNRHE